MRKTLFSALLGLLLLVGGAVLPSNSAQACGTRCQVIPSVASIPYVLPQDERQRERRASPPVFTARVHECVVREVTLTARTRELLAEREAQARQRAECLPAGTREAYALQVQRNAELAEKVSELQAEIIRLQAIMAERAVSPTS